jgi:copper transport protein
VPTIEQNPGRGPERELRRTERREFVVLAAVIAVRAVLVNVRTAREALAAGGGPFFARVDIDATNQLDIDVAPNKVGPNEAHLSYYGNGLPADVAKQVTVRLSLPAQGIGPLEHEGTRLGPGHWVVQLDDLSIPGKWQMDVVTRTSDFDQVTTTEVLDVSA